MIANAKIGDKINIELTTNRTVVGAVLNEIKTYGIEVKQYIYVRKQNTSNIYTNEEVLKFFPFHNIVSITRHQGE